jgi:hypothetical protein
MDTNRVLLTGEEGEDFLETDSLEEKREGHENRVGLAREGACLGCFLEGVKGSAAESIDGEAVLIVYILEEKTCDIEEVTVDDLDGLIIHL